MYGDATSPRDPWQPQQSGSPAVLLAGYRDFVQIAGSTGSVVYRAHQEALDRPVAIKVLSLNDPEALARFQREIEITVGLGRQHPYIVKVIDTGTTPDGRPCIVMEYYDRGSLLDRLRAHGPLPVSEVLEAGATVADALAFAHRQGVIHRDIKPQNILVLPTSYVVADFGIARRVDNSQRTSSLDWFTFQHASPQVVDGDTPTVADDVWSLGSTLFMLLEGDPPFASDMPSENTPLTYMKRVRTGVPRKLRRPDVPPGLVSAIERCLRPNREDRFTDAATLRDALRRVVADERSWAPRLREQPTSATDRQPEQAMSPQALAHLVASAAAAGRAGVDSQTSAPIPAPRVRPAGRQRALIGAAIALVLTGALAIGAALLVRQPKQSAAAAPPATTSPAPTRQNINRPDLAPVITAVEAGNGSVLLRWSDPTRGQASFIVVHVSDGKGTAVRELDPGVTEVTLLGQVQPYCYLVIAVIGSDEGVSLTQCAPDA